MQERYKLQHSERLGLYYVQTILTNMTVLIVWNHIMCWHSHNITFSIDQSHVMYKSYQINIMSEIFYIVKQ